LKIEQYYSHGKFLLSGEYFVLHGAKALALPLSFGQTTEVYYSGTNESFAWFSLQRAEKWFSARFHSQSLEILECSDLLTAKYVQRLLKVASAISGNVDFSKINRIINHLDFNRLWGLGSSSSIIANVAQWLKINALDLHFSISKGSGYDVATALSATPLVYSLKDGVPEIEPNLFYPSFHNQLHFIYLNKKQNSEQSVKQFIKKQKPEEKAIKRISEITQELINCTHLEDFKKLIKEHESIISEHLQMETAKEKLFPDFKGEIKSLGAWGGDFVLAASDIHHSELENYFKEKGFSTILNYNEIVKKGIERVGDFE